MYTLAKARLDHYRRQQLRPPVHLPTDSDANEDLLAPPLTASADVGGLSGDVPKEVGAPKHMRGWAYLLLWLPAACDLTGTTVSVTLFHVSRFRFCESCAVLLFPFILMVVLGFLRIHLIMEGPLAEVPVQWTYIPFVACPVYSGLTARGTSTMGCWVCEFHCGAQVLWVLPVPTASSIIEP